MYVVPENYCGHTTQDGKKSTIIAHSFPAGDYWQRCLRCGMTWKYPSKADVVELKEATPFMTVEMSLEEMALKNKTKRDIVLAAFRDEPVPAAVIEAVLPTETTRRIKDDG